MENILAIGKGSSDIVRGREGLVECEGLPKSENSIYLQAKEEALKIAKPFPILQADFVETLAMIFEESEEISGGRAAELMDRITHLLKCLKVCHKHKLMREVMGMDNNQNAGEQMGLK